MKSRDVRKDVIELVISLYSLTKVYTNVTSLNFDQLLCPINPTNDIWTNPYSWHNYWNKGLYYSEVVLLFYFYIIKYTKIKLYTLVQMSFYINKLLDIPVNEFIYFSK